jgi:hypothetical protein
MVNVTRRLPCEIGRYTVRDRMKRGYDQLATKHSALTAAHALLQEEQDSLLNLNDGILREYAPHLLQTANSALKFNNFIKQPRLDSSAILIEHFHTSGTPNWRLRGVGRVSS